MSKMKLKVRGVVEPSAEGAVVDLGPFSQVLNTPAYTAGFRFRPTDRSQIVDDHEIEPDDDDIVELKYADGTRRYMRAGRLAAEFGLAPSRGSSERVITAEAFGTGAERGVGKEIVEGLEVFGIDLPNLVGRKLADFLSEHIEGRFNRDPGLYRVAYGDFRAGPEVTVEPTELVPAGKPPADKPILVFIHGTGSNFSGSFGALWQPTQDEQRSADRWGTRRVNDWRAFVAQAYGRDVYALEHPSLTASPMANAIGLLEALPKGARLHLVSHSRGGLVGELMARAKIAPDGRGRGRDDSTPILPAEKRIFEDKRPGRQAQLKELKHLNELLRDKEPRVERFVRVACPTRGTTLADGKLEDWLSGFTSLVERFLPVGESDIYYFLKTLTLAVIKQKADPSVLSGIEAMRSDSPFIAFINSGPKLDADLSVIAGDTDAEGWIPWMWPVDKFFATEHFPEGRNDLVVPTLSMSLGHERSNGRARSFSDRGGSVNHFNYFRNRKTYDRLVAALSRAESESAGFDPVETAARGRGRIRRGRGSEPRPRLIMIPGISGSHIEIKKDRIWLQIREIIFGQLTKLDLHGAGQSGPGTGPDGIIDKFYGKLGDFLDATHEVEEFGYDWRVSLENSAVKLDKTIRDALHHSDQPVRVLAHSMGGLVVRAWVGRAVKTRAKSRNPTTWDLFKRNPDNRIIMLGTPTLGSYSIPRLLLGRDALIKRLDRADPFNDAAELLAVFNRFPGILSLLPRNEDWDFTDLEIWRQIRTADDADWPLPEASDLAAVQDDWSLLENSLDTECMLYVAGKADTTPTGLAIQDGGVAFEGTTAGDGRVPWATGIPQALKDKNKVWYSPAVHGDLCRHEASFGALQDLIQNGTTNRLPQNPPATRSAQSFDLPDDRLVVYPDEDMLLSAALGASDPGMPRLEEEPADIPVVRVGVTHGDLHHQDDRPIIVGHYVGDTLISAEKALDKRLGGRLSEIRDLRIYPGLIGTSEIVLEGQTGAVVVGLGEVGDLNPPYLQRTLRDGLLRYARAVAERDRLALGQDRVTNYGVAVAALLVGTGTGGVTLDESIRALLSAVAEANYGLAEKGLPVRIADLELLELYEDLAIAAAKKLQLLSEGQRWTAGFAFEPKVKHARGGWRRGIFEEQPGWWRRIQIVAEKDGSLKYSTPTDKARVEVRVQATQRKLIDQFVSDATRLSRRDKKVEQALFELLLPNPLKHQFHNQRNLVLMVDKETARYPWEMLNDFHQRSAGREPNKPLSVRQGVVRQLYGEVFRERAMLASGTKALVIGDPPSEFPDLPGAQEEAHAVTQQLAAGDYQVESLIKTSASPRSVVESLFADHYRLVHLAGHGVFNYQPEKKQFDPEYAAADQEPKRISGMVLGDGIFLTPIEIEQMRVVPELVFINCCSLGRIEPEQRTLQPAQLFAERSALAANLATQFIQMGARAVVAAGWEVEDTAAQAFAAAFYRALLAGQSFGASITEARRDTFERRGQTNTWGAYQCYGDPDYRLQRVPGGGSHKVRRLPYVSPAEALIDIDNVVARSRKQFDGTKDPQTSEAELKRWLQVIQDRADEKWLLNRADIQTKLGQAYGELNDFGEAIRWYDKAIANADPKADADYPAKAIDQRANLKARSARLLAEHGDLAAAVRQIGSAIENLKRLAEIQPSVERHAGVASAFKRKAQLKGLNRRAKNAALRSCAEAYFEAAKFSFTHKNHYNPYPGINALAVEQLTRWRDKGVKSPAVNPEELIEAFSKESWNRAPLGFWERTYRCDLEFIKSMYRGSLGDDRNRLIKKYRTLLEFASRRERDSVINQLEFIRDFAPERESSIIDGIIKEIRAAERQP